MAKFIPLDKLAQHTDLNHDQQLLLKLHERAKRLHGNVKLARGQFKQNEKDQRLLMELEKDAEHAAYATLTKAIDYYHSHDKLERSYDELRRAATVHWSPGIAREYENAFVRAILHHINNGNIAPRELTPQLAYKIDHAAKMSGYAEKIAAQMKGRGKLRKGDVALSLRDVAMQREQARFIAEAEQPKRPRKELPS